MAITDVKIANMALSLVKEKPIVRLNQTGSKADAIGIAYDIVRDELLEAVDNWSFLQTRRTLVELADADGTIEPAFGSFDHQYVIPTWASRVVATLDANGDKISYPANREVYAAGGSTFHDVLLSNQDTCYVMLLIKRTNENEWPAWFIKLFYHDLAMIIGGPLTKEKEFNELSRWRLRAYNEAVAANGLESFEVLDNHKDVDMGSSMMDDVRQDYGIA